MWDAIAPVDAEYDPILYEGTEQAAVLVTNAGPGVVRLVAWNLPNPHHRTEPEIHLELRPGNTRVVKATLIRVRFDKAFKTPPYAAIGWSVKL